MKRRPPDALLALFLVAAGCRVGPDYERPDVDVPAAWRSAEADARETANTRWWEQFGDPVLNDLIAAALRQNLDLRIATARLEEFRGRLEVAGSGLYPTVAATAAAGGSRNSTRGPIPAIPGVRNPIAFYQAGLTASWELDLWGKIRRSVEAARADLLAGEEARRSVILALVCAVAEAYVGLIDLDRRLDIARATLKTREGTFHLFERRLGQGVISKLEFFQAKSELENAAATVPALERAVIQQENLLNLLLGRNPQDVPRGKPLDDLKPPAVPAGLPSTLLQNRPDLREAEQALMAANARIGVARAQYYPSISLTGALGVESAGLRQLFSGPAGAWSYAVQLAQPLFTGGALSGGVRIAESGREQAVLEYRRAIQTAFREVEDALADQRTTRAELAALDRQLDAVRQSVDAARLRYANGYTSFLEVLDAERSLFGVELSRAQSQGRLLAALIAVYKATGGGWVVEADEATDPDLPRH